MRQTFRSARLLPCVILAAALLAGPVRADDTQAMPVAPEAPDTSEVGDNPPDQPAELPAAGPEVILPDTLDWTPLADSPESREVWLHGSDKRAGPYLLRVRLAADGRVGVHTKPDERIFSVLSGTLSVGFGSIFDETRTHDIPAGAVFVAPADQAVYLWARDGEVEYQISGSGPADAPPPAR